MLRQTPHRRSSLSAKGNSGCGIVVLIAIELPSNGNLLARKPDGSLATKSRGHATSALNAPQPTEMYLILFEQNRQSVSRISGFSSFVTFRGKDRRHSVQVITM